MSCEHRNPEISRNQGNPKICERPRAKFSGPVASVPLLSCPQPFLNRFIESDMAVLFARHNISVPSEDLIFRMPVRDRPPPPPVQIPVFRGTPVFSM